MRYERKYCPVYIRCTGEGTPDDAACDRLMDLFTEFDGSISAGEGEWSVQLSCTATSPWRAAGLVLARMMAERAGLLAGWSPSRIEVGEGER